MCFVFSNCFDGRSYVNNGFGRYSLQRGERDARDRLELTMGVRVEKEKKRGKSRGMLGLKRLISSGGDLALDESGRNLGNGVREVALLPDSDCCPGNNRPPSPNKLNNPQPALFLGDIAACSLLICANINLRIMNRDLSFD